MLEKEGGLSIEVEGHLGLIRVVGHGFWSPIMTDAHFQELRAVVAPYRRNGQPARMIVDLRDSSVQSPETVVRMQSGVTSVTVPGDRIAIVVDSSLSKMQMRRIIGTAQHEFFVSMDAAVKWVDAY